MIPVKKAPLLGFGLALLGLLAAFPQARGWGDLRTDGSEVPVQPCPPYQGKITRTPIALRGGAEKYKLFEVAYFQQSDLADSLAFDPDGNAWFISSWNDREIRVDPRTMEISEIQLPKGCGPRSIAIDEDAVHWVLCLFADALLEVHRGRGSGTVHKPANPGFMTSVVASRSRGVVWITRPSQNAIMRFQRGQGFREYPLPTFDGGPGVPDVDAQGNVWFPQLYSNELTRFDPVLESFQEFPLPTQNALPVVTMVDSRNVVWTSEHSQDRIARFHDGRFQEIVLPTRKSGVNALAEAPDGTIWFAQGGWRGSLGTNIIGRYDPRNSAVEQVLLPTENSQPVGLRISPRGDIGFVEMGTGRIALLRKTR